MPDKKELDKGPSSSDNKNKEKKHDSGAADLEKVTDYAEEKEIISSSIELEDAIKDIRSESAKEASERLAREKELAKVAIKKEDVELIIEELEISKTKAKRVLRENHGNIIAALTALTN